MKTRMLNSQSLTVAAFALLLSPALVSAQAAKTTAPTTVASAAGTVSAEAAGTVDKTTAAPKKPGMPSQITVDREVFSYAANGRRDPYKSLMTTNDIRPLLSDLRLTAIAFDPTGANSVAILREITNKAQHRVKVGQQLGRLRVASIRPKAVVFTIEEFGFNRQETLLVSNDSTKARTP